jgi:cytochrome c-type biogenesis protein CcmH/NrfG
MQWIIVIVACVVLGGWMFRTMLGGREMAAQARQANPGRYVVGLVIFVIIAFLGLLLLGTLT